MMTFGKAARRSRSGISVGWLEEKNQPTSIDLASPNAPDLEAYWEFQ